MAIKKANEKTSAEMATIGPGLLRDSKSLPEAKTSPLQRWLRQQKGRRIILLL